MALRYFKEHDIKNIGGSKGLILTEPFNILGLDFDDKVSVKLEDNKVTIEKIGKQ